MMRDGYRLFEHTADIGIEAKGKTLTRAFEEVANGMFSIITDGSEIESKIIREFKIKADNVEELLVDFLSKLLYYHGAESLVFDSFDLNLNEERLELEVTAKGEVYDLNKHRYGDEIKGVTYHNLIIEKHKDYSIVRVLFDI
ncbi:MAG TPA: archease [Thermoplasmata archaeon]|nr:archease [Thermoplasmata archaeon]